MALTLIILAMALFDGLAIVFLIRGLRAAAREVCARCAGHCLSFAVGAALATVAGKAATVATSFAGVANAGADPSIKAEVLSQQIDAGMTIGSIGVPATAVPVIFAALLYARSRRLPAARPG